MPIDDHCPDCITLPIRPPYGCFPILLEAVKGNVTNPKEVVHCAYTVIGWGLSFYVGTEGVAALNKELTAEQLACDPVKELEKCCKLKPTDGVGFDPNGVGKIDWKALIAKLLPLLISLL